MSKNKLDKSDILNTTRPISLEEDWTYGTVLRPDPKFDALNKFYEYLWNKDRKKSLAFPRSEIFYIRSLLNEKFGKDYSLVEVVELLKEEGLLKKGSNIPAQPRL